MRLFTGLSIENETRENLERILATLRLSATLKNWSPVANLHITTKFIGEWPEAKVEELQQALANVKFPAPVSVAISRFGFFPDPHHPRALFAGVQAGLELHELARRIDETVAAIGGARETRPYLPHVTLARIRNENIQALREQIASMTDFDFGSFQAEKFHLYESRDGGYKVLSSYGPERAT